MLQPQLMAAADLSYSGALLLAGALLLVFISPMHETSASFMPVAGLIPERDLKHQDMTGICKSKDIRNSLRSFDSLKGCRVVEGFVQILLFDNINETAFDAISFPELTEITGYLLLYRVSGLKSVGQLFPNLTVIRGQEKIYEYSFVVYEMSSLQEIGLHSLTDITQGLIRIDKNPSLCYVNSIDWNLITGEKGDHFIKNIKPEMECPLCPGDDGVDGFSCPVSNSKPMKGRHLCWNRQHCQKVCPAHCKNSTCDINGKCCSEMCLGGCKLGNTNSCRVCRKFAMWENGKCMESCPYDTYEYLERRCITRDECIKAKKPLMIHTTIQNEHPYKIHNRSCILKCPSDHMDDYVKHTCTPCLGRCKKECQGMVIDSLYSAQQMRGCTHVNGSLEIQIRGGNKGNEFEENLNMIEEIDGYLKIVRSFPLVSLNFFKRLKVIKGNTLESQKHVFIVLDNQNLQDIWDWENRTLIIGKGKLFFHFNPRLCMNKIIKLQQKANLSDFTELEVAPNSNGDKIACDVKDLVVSVTGKRSNAVILRWQQFKMKDYRKLLGYVVYSKEALFKNVTLYDGRDACGGDGWRVDDVPITDEQNPTHLLSKLKAYTQYAFYVKTYTIASEDSGAQSQIYYVRTLPDRPSIPNLIRAELPTVIWDPPRFPNGNVTYYIITGELRPEYNLNDRNYCKPLNQSLSDSKAEEPKISTSTNNVCECNEISKPVISKLKNASTVEDQNNFQDRLYNYVYLKRKNNNPTADTTRRKRDSTVFPNQSNEDHSNDLKEVVTHTDKHGRYTSFNFTIYGKTEYVFKRLKHFSEYEIKIQACRQQEGEEDTNPQCSQTNLVQARTGRKVGADMVSGITFNQSLGMITFAWEEPLDPNGYITHYNIEYKILDIPHSITTQECITAAEYLNRSKRYTFEGLNPGNYSLRIISNSLAGQEESEYVYFYIEVPSTTSTNVIIFVVITFLLILVSVAYYFWKKRSTIVLIPTVNPDYYNNKDYVPDDWEVARDNIKLIKELGQGSFGMVYEGVAKDIIKGKSTIRCAIKTVNEHATDRERIEFLNEASVMKAFDTAHVVRLMGVVSQGQPTLVVMELMTNGDLKSYLRSHRPDHSCDKSSKQPPTLKKILQMAIEISDGMAYLSAKKFVHRDLAARNCMVAEDLTVKIGDFGMTRDIYETDYYRKGTKGLLPVRWMAPESLKDGVFTSNSDVWSYGVVLWEMSTLASQPYQGLSNDQVLRYVIGGGIMERPENCPDKLYDLMMCCWRHKPSDRPSFLHLCALLLEDASTSFNDVSFYHSVAGMEARNSKSSQSPSQDDPSTPLRRNEIDENFSLTSSDSEHEIEAESNFTTYPSMTQNISSTANGYVTTRATNGTTTT